jgi:soluble lytic murein transglycosylase-like protein
MTNTKFLLGAVVLGVGVTVYKGKNMIDLSNANENEKKYAPLIAEKETKYGIKTGVLHKLIKQESAFRTDVITGAKKSSVGALGIAQFMPATAKEWLGSAQNALNPALAIDGAARYLKWLYMQTGEWTKAVAAYNWGIGNVKNKGLASAPSETKKYVKNILGVTV